ncbi:MAG: two-component system CitB family sensor histidine kinase DctS [Bacillota bacterium]|nr:MAG: two-component system CitB family sensor histidine kinase DctS [Bacillota bacterium]
MRLSLRWQVFMLVLGVMIASLAIAGIMVTQTISDILRYHIGMQALGVAQSVAELPVVRQWVGKPGGDAYIRPLAEQIRLRTGFEILVVIDTDSVRYTHPVPERIGQKFVGGDEGKALLGEEYISQAIGTLGPSQRSFAPIYGYAGQVVGAVMVGGLIPSLEAQLVPVRGAILAALAVGMAVGSVGAGLLSGHIKATLYGMEPEQIASVLHSREAILQSVREGIIAVDRNGLITLMNDVSKDYLGLDEGVIGRPINLVVPSTRLPQVLQSGQAEYDQDQIMGEVRVVTNRLPIVVEGKVVGAVATFRDRREIARLAEELSGVRRYIEALRVQTHEFSNKLHTISGLIQLGNHDEAIDYIHTVHTKHSGLTGEVLARINDPGVAAIIIGKIGRANELGIRLELSIDSKLEALPTELRQAVTAIVGNLADNALEALASNLRDNPLVLLRLQQTELLLTIEVMDNGPGVSERDKSKIFEFGFSTKAQQNRGLGLHIINTIATTCGGEIKVESEPDVLTHFTITLPMCKGCEAGGH